LKEQLPSPVHHRLGMTQLQFSILPALVDPATADSFLYANFATPQALPDRSAPGGADQRRIFRDFPALQQPDAQGIIVLVHAPIVFSRNSELKQHCTPRLASPAFDLLFARPGGSVADVASFRSDFADVVRWREAAILEQHRPPPLQLASLPALAVLLTHIYSVFIVPLPLMPPLCSEWSLVECVAARLRPAGDEPGAAVGTWETQVRAVSFPASPFEDPVLQAGLKDLTSSYIVMYTSREYPHSPIRHHARHIFFLAQALSMPTAFVQVKKDNSSAAK
jgi:hypothetical protein